MSVAIWLKSFPRLAFSVAPQGLVFISLFAGLGYVHHVIKLLCAPSMFYHKANGIAPFGFKIRPAYPVSEFLVSQLAWSNS